MTATLLRSLIAVGNIFINFNVNLSAALIGPTLLDLIALVNICLSEEELIELIIALKVIDIKLAGPCLHGRCLTGLCSPFDLPLSRSCPISAGEVADSGCKTDCGENTNTCRGCLQENIIIIIIIIEVFNFSVIQIYNRNHCSLAYNQISASGYSFYLSCVH